MPPRTSQLRRPLESLFKRHAIPRRTLIAAPKENSGPLMERRADRELPAIQSPYRWLRTMPLFLAVMAASTFAIFNYQKQSSSVVTSTLYALRTNPEARAVLGDEVYFANKIPWISGEINQLHGRIDISFWVKGTKQKALMKFKSNRKHRMGVFETTDWSLQLEDGTVIELLGTTGPDPFNQTPMESAVQAQAA